MSTLTKEWLQKTIAELEEERDAVPGVVNEDAAMALAAMKRALASLEAEPVAYVSQSNLDALKRGHKSVLVKRTDDVARPVALYAAPPAPMLPEGLLSAVEEVLRISDRDHEAWNKAKSAIAGCRAAMLQGAEKTEPLHAVKDAPALDSSSRIAESLHADFQGAENAESRCTIQTVPALGSLPKNAESRCGNSPVIPDGWVMVPVEPTTNQWAAGMQAFDSGMDKVTRVYKAMLSAAPQQEVQ
ncbi:hypothetical protein Q8V88_002629 [Enterobacter hormaechei]|nr:hypothetical protein [Enterobacter hormaechei]